MTRVAAMYHRTCCDLNIIGRTALVFIVLLSSPGAHAQPARERNAADIYREAFALMSDSDRQLLMEYLSGESSVERDQVRAVLSRARPAMQLLREAAALERVDFGVDYSAGPETLLPHLGLMRDASRFLIADARIHLAAGDTRGAAESWADSLRMSRHVTSDPVIVSSLIGVAMFRGAHQDLRRALDEGLLDMSAARDVLDATRALSARDTFGFVASLEGERAGMSGWLIETFSGDGGLERMWEHVDFFTMPGSMSESESEFLTQLADMSQPELDAAIHAYDLAQERMVAAAKLGDLHAVKAEMARIQEDVRRGAYGLMPTLMMPALDRYIEAILAAYDDLNRLTDDLELVAASPDGALVVRNAALWYLRAMALYRELDEGTVRTLEDLATTRPTRLDETMVTALEHASPILEQLFIATSIERCDFDLEDAWAPQGMLADMSHIEGMVSCATVLAADAWAHVTAMDSARRSAGALRLAGLFRMADHLGTDARVESSIAASGIAELAARACETLDAQGIALDRPSAALVRNAMSRTAMGDPFGFLAARRSYRGATSKWLIERYVRDGFARELFINDLPRLAGDRASEIVAAIEPLTDVEAADALRALDRLMAFILTTGSLSVQDEPPGPNDATANVGREPPPSLREWLVRPLEHAEQVKQGVLERLRGLSIDAAD